MNDRTVEHVTAEPDAAPPRGPLSGIRVPDAAGGAALRLPSGEFVDLPVAERARRLLQLAESLSTA